MDIERIGAFLGIVAFLGLAVLILLVIQQARDLRRLRNWAGVAPERAIEAAETKGEEVPEPEHGRLARPFINLGAGIHDRTARMWSGVRSGYRAADRRSPVDLRFILGFLAIAAIAGLVLLTSGFGLYGEDEGKQRKGKTAPPPERIEVAVLNGTAASGTGAVPGFANEIAQKVKQAGYKVGRVGDTDTSFVESVVMYEPGMKAAARGLAGDLDGTLGQTSTQSIVAEVRDLAGNADLALVLGPDDAQPDGAAPAPEAPETTESEVAPVAPETAPVPGETTPTG